MYPCSVRPPRAMARRTSLSSGFAGLVSVSVRPMRQQYARIRIPQMRSVLSKALSIGLLALFGYVIYVSVQIGRQSTVDEARPADVILVLGAAEYRGRPSPVLKARLDHALELFGRHLAPRIMTTGGSGGEHVYTEGTVGRAYLTSHGVPPEAVIVENEGESTVK